MADAKFDLYNRASIAAKKAARAADDEARRESWEIGGGLWYDEASDQLYDARDELGPEVYELARKLIAERDLHPPTAYTPAMASLVDGAASESSADKATITFELDGRHALALAQFVKRVGWAEMRVCAVDDDEARAIGEAIATLQKALADKGWAPR
jgi:hypothetical protein